MTRKHLRTISLLLSFMAISSVAYAAPTVTNNRDSEAPSLSHHEVLRRTAARAEAVPQVYNDSRPGVEAWTYQGGPKSSVGIVRSGFQRSHPGGR
jgi:hypothetical protein